MTTLVLDMKMIADTLTVSIVPGAALEDELIVLLDVKDSLTVLLLDTLKVELAGLHIVIEPRTTAVDNDVEIELDEDESEDESAFEEEVKGRAGRE